LIQKTSLALESCPLVLENLGAGILVVDRKNLSKSSEEVGCSGVEVLKAFRD